jgi:hypothetical protein
MSHRRVVLAALLAFVTAGCAYWVRDHADTAVAPDAWVTTLDEPSHGSVTAPPPRSPAPSPVAVTSRNCTVDQILAMRNLGLSGEQIRRACEPH